MNETAAQVLRGELLDLEYEIERANEMHLRDLQTVREEGRRLLELENQRHDILLALGNYAIVPIDAHMKWAPLHQMGGAPA